MNGLSRISLFAILAAGAISCSPRRVAETFFLGNHFIRTADLRYGNGPRHHLDVYQPRSGQKALPVVLFLYGGRWQSGSKEDYRLLGNALTRRGFVVVVPDYRFYPDTIFPGWVLDAARAVHWTQHNIGRYGGDTAQIFIVGHSAGAHTAALLALDERYLREAGVSASSVLGYVSLAGPVLTTWTDADVQALMGPRENWPATYPSTYIDGTEKPFLLMHGLNDKTVSPQNSAGLAARIRQRGGCAKVILYPNLGHVELVVALAEPRISRAPVLDDVIKFTKEIRISNRECAK